MLVYLITFNILLTLFPIIYASVHSDSNPGGLLTILSSNGTLNALNKTKITVASEGGSIVSDVRLPQGNKTIQVPQILNLDEELGQSKKKSVAARKGVVYDASDENVKTIVNITENIQENNSSNTQNNTVASADPKNTIENVTNTVKQVNTTKVHKPLVLSYETLAKLHDNVDEVVPHIKIHEMDANRHPGMIMPIVIAILVVPMFAILGYMALKRGKEAWKNRHYKRMDFLLDGMYND